MMCSSVAGLKNKICHRKTTSSPHREEEVFNLLGLVWLEMNRSKKRGLSQTSVKCWDESFYLRLWDTIWHTCTANNSLCVGEEGCNHRSVCLMLWESWEVLSKATDWSSPQYQQSPFLLSLAGLTEQHLSPCIVPSQPVKLLILFFFFCTTFWEELKIIWSQLSAEIVLSFKGLRFKCVLL